MISSERIQEIVLDLSDHIKKLEDGQNFFDTPRDKLGKFHHGFGTWVRNHYGLWEHGWEPELVEGVDHSPHHPDNVCMKILEMVWDKR